jgi:hypothetical protein
MISATGTQPGAILGAYLIFMSDGFEEMVNHGWDKHFDLHIYATSFSFLPDDDRFGWRDFAAL